MPMKNILDGGVSKVDPEDPQSVADMFTGLFYALRDEGVPAQTALVGLSIAFAGFLARAKPEHSRQLILNQVAELAENFAANLVSEAERMTEAER